MTRVRFPPPAPYIHHRENYKQFITTVSLLMLYRDIFFSTTHRLARICSYSSAVEHSLGKGEVLSSILNMSSIYCLSFCVCFAIFTQFCVDIEIYNIENYKYSVAIDNLRVTLRCCPLVLSIY